MKKHTQTKRVFKLLKKRNKVMLPQLLDLRISGFRARISDLRGLGCVIENSKFIVGGEWHSVYRMEWYPAYLSGLFS